MSGQTQIAGDLVEGEDEYNTPLKWVSPIAEILSGFDFDPCASASSNLADHNIRETGGLEADWSRFDIGWCNHPYGRGEPPKWLRKAAEADCETIVTLSKGDPSADWFHDYLAGEATLVCFPDERIKFVDEDNSAKFPNVYGVFGECPDELLTWFESIGWTVMNP